MCVTSMDEYTHTIDFSIPNEYAGNIIGKAGRTVRELMEESGGRIEVEREVDVEGMRRVVIKHINEDMALHTKALVLDRLPVNAMHVASSSNSLRQSHRGASRGGGWRGDGWRGARHRKPREHNRYCT